MTPSPKPRPLSYPTAYLLLDCGHQVRTNTARGAYIFREGVLCRWQGCGWRRAVVLVTAPAKTAQRIFLESLREAAELAMLFSVPNPNSEQESS